MYSRCSHTTGSLGRLAKILRRLTPCCCARERHVLSKVPSQWIQTALWGFSVFGIFVGYLPPKRSLNQSSIEDRLRKIDWLGSIILTSAIALFVTGLNLVTSYQWTSGQVLGPLCSGVVAFIAFGLYETYGTDRGIVPHALFQGEKRFGWAFTNFCALFFIEGITFFAILAFYPAL